MSIDLCYTVAMRSFASTSSSLSTSNAQRKGARLIGLLYYLIVIPLFIDLFREGIHWKSPYLLVFLLLGVLGVQIGYRETDAWVRLWSQLNISYVCSLLILDFVSKTFQKTLGMYKWEPFVHIGLAAIAIAFILYDFFDKPKTISLDAVSDDEEEEDIEKFDDSM